MTAIEPDRTVLNNVRGLADWVFEGDLRRLRPEDTS